MRLPVLIAAALWLSAGSALAHNVETHGHVTVRGAELLKRTDAAGLYAEVYRSAHVAAMWRGSIDADYGSVQGNARGHRHYYDPDGVGPAVGLRYQNYFRVWWMADEAKRLLGAAIRSDFGYEGVEVTPPPGGYYPGALEWASDGAGTGDPMNWQGALSAYDYPARSREVAYERLGHVVHLLQDMADPDHAQNIPHPGSDFEVSAAVATGTPGATGKRYGYEAFIQANLGSLKLAAAGPQRRTHLAAYFNQMARAAKKAIEGKLTVPLGLEFIRVRYFHEDLGQSAEYDIPLLPAIDPADKEVAALYIDLADRLLTQATEFTAGVYQDFHDIVNQPPYVREVRIEQAAGDGPPGGAYEAVWHDVCESPDGSLNFTRRRELERQAAPLVAGRPARVVVDFGPDGERIDPATVRVTVDRQPIEGRLTAPARWEGTFVPALPGRARRCRLPLEIQAADVHHHRARPGLPERGYALDGDPSSPAVLAEVVEPYDWAGFEPGPDAVHAVMVYGAGAGDGGAGDVPPQVHLGPRDIGLVGSFAAAAEGGRTREGVVHADGRIILPPQFNRVCDFYDGIASVEVDRKFGYVNAAGRWVVKPQYDEACDFSEGLAVVCRRVPNPDREGWKKDQWGVIDRSGRVVMPLSLEGLPGMFHEGLARATENWKWSTDPLGQKHVVYEGKPGYIGPHGQWAFTGDYIHGQEFGEGVAAVQVLVKRPDGSSDRKFGYVDRTGRMVIAPQFDKADPFYLGYARVKVNLSEGFRWIDHGGSLLDGVFRYPLEGQEFRDGLSPHIENQAQGYINPRGRFVIPPRYSDCRPFREGLGAVSARGTGNRPWGFVNEKGEEIVPPRYWLVGDFSEGLAFVAAGDRLDNLRFGYVDKTGREVIPPRFHCAGPLLGGLARVAVGGRLSSGDTLYDGKWGFIDRTGQFVIEPQFEQAGDFSEGLAAACVQVRDPSRGLRSLWGYVNREGKFAIAPRFGRARPFSEGLAAVSDSAAGRGSWQFIDASGRLVIPGPLTEVARFSEGLCAALLPIKTGHAWGYIDRTGDVVIKPMFRRAADFHDGAALVGPGVLSLFIDRAGRPVPRDQVDRVLDKTRWPGAPGR